MIRGSFCYEPPISKGAKLLLLTEGMTCIVGVWGDGAGLIAWTPLPKRDKKIEAEKGLI